MPRSRIFGALVLSCLLAACATLPAHPAERALYVDVQKALQAESRLGWTVDRVEIQEAAAQAEPSACRVPKQRRANLYKWVEQRIAIEGGPAEQQFARGVERDELDDVIALERTRSLLDSIELHVPEDCPFWVRASEDFEGIHSVANRFVAIAESMGGGSLSIGSGRVLAGAGGAVRLFGAYGPGPHLQLALGLEAGGDAVLEEETRGTLAPEGAFRFGAPLLVRWTDIDRVYDVELAAVTRLTSRELTPWGLRVAIAGGVSGLRRLGFMPALQIYVGYEIYPEQDIFALQHVLRLGTRVGLDWDP